MYEYILFIVLTVTVKTERKVNCFFENAIKLVWVHSVNVLCRFEGYFRKLQRAATMMFSVFHAGMYHMNLMMFYMLKERYRQIVNNRRLMIISKRFYLKKLFIKRQKRTCWFLKILFHRPFHHPC